MAIVKGKPDKTTFVLTEHILKKLQTYQSPDLATLIYVDSDRSLPTGQWSAESSAVYKRGSRFPVPT